jgi:hypothetical protein
MGRHIILCRLAVWAKRAQSPWESNEPLKRPDDWLLKRLLLWSAVGLLLFTLFGFFALPYILKMVLTSQLRGGSIASTIKSPFQPFYLTLQVKTSLKERDGTDRFVSFEELALNLEAASI